MAALCILIALMTVTQKVCLKKGGKRIITTFTLIFSITLLFTMLCQIKNSYLAGDTYEKTPSMFVLSVIEF